MAANPTAMPPARRRRWPLAAAALALGLALSGCAGAGAVDPDAIETDPMLTETPTAEPTPVEGTDAPDASGAPGATDGPAETGAAETEPPADPRREVAIAVIGIEYLGADTGIEVRSFVAEYIGEGTCRFIATGADGVERTAEVAALPDAQSTVCPTTYLDDLAPGVYEVVVEFSNDEVLGTSDPVEVEADV